MSQSNSDAQISSANRKQKVTDKSFSAKFKSKREIYTFLSIDVGVYLPSYGKSSLALYSPLVSLRRASHYLLL